MPTLLSGTLVSDRRIIRYNGAGYASDINQLGAGGLLRLQQNSVDKLIVTNAGDLQLLNAASRIVPGATSLSLRNNADSADNLLMTDAGAATFRNTVTISTAGASVLSLQSSGLGGAGRSILQLLRSGVGWDFSSNVSLDSTDNYAVRQVGGTLDAVKVFQMAYNTADVTLTQAANGQQIAFKVLTENLTLANAATTNTVLNIPAGAVLLSADVRVTTAISGGGATSFQVKGATSGTVFSTSTTLALAAGTTDKGTAAGTFYNAAAQHVQIAVAGGSPTAGVVRVTIHYYEITPASS